MGARIARPSASIARGSPQFLARSSRWARACGAAPGTGTRPVRPASPRTSISRRFSPEGKIEMTETFVVLSFYAYFVLFLIVEFVVTRSRLGAKRQGDRDRMS